MKSNNSKAISNLAVSLAPDTALEQSLNTTMANWVLQNCEELKETIISVALTIITSGNTREEDNQLGGRCFEPEELTEKASQIVDGASTIRTWKLWNNLAHQLARLAGIASLPTSQRPKSFTLLGGRLKVSNLYNTERDTTLQLQEKGEVYLLTQHNLNTQEDTNLFKLYHRLQVLLLSEPIPTYKEIKKGMCFLLTEGDEGQTYFLVTNKMSGQLHGYTLKWEDGALSKEKGESISYATTEITTDTTKTFLVRVMKTVDPRTITIAAEEPEKWERVKQYDPSEKTEIKEAPERQTVQHLTYVIEGIERISNPANFEDLNAPRFHALMSTEWVKKIELTAEQKVKLSGLYLIQGYTKLAKKLREKGVKHVLRYSSQFAKAHLGHNINRKDITKAKVQAAYIEELETKLIKDDIFANGRTPETDEEIRAAISIRAKAVEVLKNMGIQQS
jgi:hypothetical protein